MKVHELIDILEDLDPDAEVLIMSQENWPFENAVAGIALREDFAEDVDEFDDDDDEEDSDDDEVERRREDGTAPGDVFIVEGQQLRYGSKAAWNVATR